MTREEPASERVVRLRPTVPADVPRLYELQSDPQANAMAGTKPRTREAYWATWEKIFADPQIISRVMVITDEVVGGVSVFQAEGRDMLGYWVAREYWGKGVASRGVALFLGEVSRRPLYATAACANTGSLRVLEKCGFRLLGQRMGEETERYVGCEIADFVLE